MTVCLENDPSARPLRPGRRMQYIEPIVASLKDELAPPERRRLSHALSMLIDSEAAVAVRDIGGATGDEALAAAAWAAQALVIQARAEAAEERRKLAAARPA